MGERYFPQGIATDIAFCNRESERTALKASINAHEHIVLVAPRRYGKTSLLSQVLLENKFVGVRIDLFFVLSQSEVRQAIANAVAELMAKILPKNISAKQKIINKLKTINPKLTINILGQKLEIITKQHTDQSISELLLALDQAAVAANKTCVMVLDEFQQISELRENHAIEAAIRHAVESSSNVSYIFCGSKRHLLHEMFSDKSRPLYHLCDLMTIERISPEHYLKFINKMSKKRWQKVITSDAASEIIHLTENHPYYLNALCRYLWREPNLPDIGLVRKHWQEYVTRQAPWIISDLSALTLNRKQVLAALSQKPTKEPLGREFSTRASLNPSGIQKSLSGLLKLDMVYIDNNGFYKVLDPAIAFYIRENSL